MIITRRHFLSNAALSVLQVLVSGTLFFFLYRYLLGEIGAEQLGLWSVILASTSAARLSDLGLTGGVVKYVAMFRAKGDLESAAKTVETTAISIGVIMGVLLLFAQPILTLVLTKTIPKASLPIAMEILPLAMVAFWGASISGVFHASLDGCQQAGRRNGVLIFGNISFFAGAMAWVPDYGIAALAWSQIGQSALTAIISWVILRRYLTELPPLPHRWSLRLFKRMFRYSASFQVNSIAVMLCDPLTKVLMARFGGLSATAYYEMASQLVNKLRSLMVSANQVVVPVVAEAYESSPGLVRDIYQRSYRLVFFVALAAYAGLLLTMPLISQIWIGYLNVQFLAFSVILIAANFVNNLAVPAYFDNLGTGHLRWNTATHVTMAGVNGVLGMGLGMALGAYGVALAAGLAIAVGSLMIIFAVQRQYQLEYSELIPKEHRRLASVVAALCAAGITAVVYLYSIGSNVLVANLIILTGSGIAYLLVVRGHNYWAPADRAVRRFLQKSDPASR